MLRSYDLASPPLTIIRLSWLLASNLVVGAGLAAVADELEAADDLANGEEADELSGDDTAGGELGVGDVADVVEDGLGGLEEAAGAEGGPGVLVEGLEGGDGTAWRS